MATYCEITLYVILEKEGKKLQDQKQISGCQRLLGEGVVDYT